MQRIYIPFQGPVNIFKGIKKYKICSPVFGIVAVVFFLIIGAVNAMAIEEAKYDVVEKDGKFEIRDYASRIIAETIVEGTLEDAGNIAFKKLFDYISGNNRSRIELDMTAPVSQKSAGEKIDMTAPVGQRRIRDKWAVSFVMPASYTLETLPVPNDPAITLRQIPTRRMAAVRYSGFWSEENYLQNKSALESWIAEKGLISAGAAIWARYNPPFMPWFLRRNEILIPVKKDTGRTATPDQTSGKALP